MLDWKIDAMNNIKRPSPRLQGFIAASTFTVILVVFILNFKFHRELKTMAEEEFAQQQLILARSTADGIEVYLKALVAELLAMSSDIHNTLQMSSAHNLLLPRTSLDFPCKTSIRILDHRGVLRDIYPFEGWRRDLIGNNYSDKKYFWQVIETGQISFSGFIHNEQGEPRIRLAVPIPPSHRSLPIKKNVDKFVSAGENTTDLIKKKENEIQGILVGSIDPGIIAREFISPVVSGRTGYAWLMDEDGIFLAHQVKAFVGQNAFSIRCEKKSFLPYEAINKIQTSMLRGSEGIGRYISGWHRSLEGEIEKLVAYSPVRLKNTLWSVAVCAPISEVESMVNRTRHMEWYSLGFVTVLLILCGYFLFISGKRWSHCLEQRVIKQTKRFKQVQDRHQLVLEHMRNAVAVFEPVDDGLDFILKSFNQAGQAIEKVDRTKMLGKSILEIFPGFRTFLFFDIFRKVWVTGSAEQISLKGYSKDRSIQWRKMYIYKLPSGENVLVYTDETEREQAKIALKDSEKRLKAIVSASPVGIGLVINRRINWVNKAMIDMLGYSGEAELLGKDAVVFYSDTEEYRRVGSQIYLPVDGFGVRRMETKWVREDGSTLDCYLQVCAVDPQDLLQGHIFAVIDISEQKENYREQKALRERIRQMEKMETIGFLAGGIAHDFNNILFPIVGYTELLLQDAPEGSELNEVLTRILKAAGRATELVQQILTFSRQGDTGLKPLRIQPVLKEALKLLRASIPSTIEISQSIGKECSMIRGNATQIHQIIMNLCTNAYHSMEDQIGEIKVILSEVDLTYADLSMDSTPVISMKPGRYLELSVIDNGHGMGPEVLKRIFEPYYTTKKVGKGTGMGLSLVFGIVKEFGGEIKVDSEPGKGSRFSIYMPVICGENVDHDNLSEDTYSRIHGRVLLIDDDEDALYVQEKMLIRLGCRVTSYKSVIAALSFFREQPNNFDLVITDLTMPKMSGDKLSKALLKIRPDLPILLCTGSSASMSPEIANNLGIMGFFRKPVKLRELEEMVHRIFKNSETTHNIPLIYGARF